MSADRDPFVSNYERDTFFRVVGDRVKAVREEHKLSQRELAERARIATSTMGNIEMGKGLSLLVAERIATALDILVDELIPTEASKERKR